MNALNRIRSAWRALRGYDAASTGRLSTGWAPPSSSATAEATSAAAVVARRARDMVRNDPYAGRTLDVWTGNTVGVGITVGWRDKAHAAAWKRWVKRKACDAEETLDFPGLQALVMNAVVESGEALVRMLMVPPTPTNPVGLQVQVLEVDHLDWRKNGVIDGRPTIGGIALGDKGQPLGYWIFRTHPGNSWVDIKSLNASLVSDFIPAAECLHVFRRRRPGQLRDVSWLARSIRRLRDLGEYEEALLMKARVEACLALVSTGESDSALTGDADGLLTDGNGNRVEGLEPGMILHRRGGGEIEVVNPSGGGSHTTFARRALEAAAVGSGITYDQISGDLTAANYSSLRAGKIEFRRIAEQVQWHMLVPMLLEPIADRFHVQGAMLGLWQADEPEVTFTPPTWEMIDPLKDTAALASQVRAGFVPLADAVASFGYTWSEVVDAIRQGNKALDDAGITLDTDPRRVSDKGVAHDPKQVAAIEIAATGAALPPQAQPQPQQSDPPTP